MSVYNIFAKINFEIKADSAEEAEKIYQNLEFWNDNWLADAEEWDHEVELLKDDEDDEDDEDE